jgi:outer membrane protein TolC
MPARLAPFCFPVRNIFIISLLLTLLLGTAQAGSPTLSFEEAWLVLRENHGNLRAADFERQRLERLQAATRGLRLPQINFEARYTHLNEAIRIDLDPVFGLIPGLSSALPPLGVTIQDQEFWKANVSAVLPLYTGGRISAARAAASLELQAATEQGRRTEHELHSTLVRRYFAVPLAAQVQTARAAAHAGARQHFQHALRLETEGLISAAERLHAEVAEAEAARALRQADRQLEMAQTALALFLNIEQLPAISTSLPQPSPDLHLDRQQLRAQSRRQHPILGALEANRLLAAEGTRVEQGRLQPEIFAFGRRELVPSDLTLLEPEWAVGLGLNFSLLDRSDRINRIRAARLRERQVSALTEQVARDLETLTESLVLEVISAAEQYATWSRMEELARENLRVRQSAFTEGLATSLEVVDARSALAQVETAKAASSYQYTVSNALLAEATGSIALFSSLLSATAETPFHP